MEAFKDIHSVFRLLDEGIITSQKAKVKKLQHEYKNYFTVLINNLDKLTKVNADIFIFDGTGDISPEYCLNNFNIVGCSRFNGDLSKLTINIVDLNTSKTKLTQKSNNQYIKLTKDYIREQPQDISTIFTYKNISDKFDDDFTVNWFGNIKGSNDYRHINHIAQIGLNRYPDLIYWLYANSIGQATDTNNTLVNRIYDEKTIDTIRCKLILADIEQNIFRSKIRNQTNDEECIYYLFFNRADYQTLIDMIKARYKKYGATINLIDTPTNFKMFKAKTRKTTKPSSQQKFIVWLTSQPKGRIFKRENLKNELGLSDNQFKDLKESGLLKSFKTNKQGIYRI